jgi:hypothetical protein
MISHQLNLRLNYFRIGDHSNSIRNATLFSERLPLVGDE